MCDGGFGPAFGEGDLPVSAAVFWRPALSSRAVCPPSSSPCTPVAPSPSPSRT